MPPEVAPADQREYTFHGMRVVGNRLVAELTEIPSGERLVLDPYRPGRGSVSAGDRVRLAPNHMLTRLERGRAP